METEGSLRHSQAPATRPYKQSSSEAYSLTVL